MTKTKDSFDNVSAMAPNTFEERVIGSFDKAQNMGPNKIFQGNQELIRSFNGAENIKPGAQQGGTQNLQPLAQQGDAQQVDVVQNTSTTPQNTETGAKK